MKPFRALMFLNAGAFFMYNVSNGINKQYIERNFTMSPAATPLAMASTNFVHTSLPSFLFNTMVLGYAGRLLALPYAGYLALGAGSALFSAVDMRVNHHKAYSGGLGLSAALITLGAFNGRLVHLLKYMPPSAFVGLMLMHGLYNSDASALGGVITGYAVFLAALF